MAEQEKEILEEADEAETNTETLSEEGENEEGAVKATARLATVPDENKEDPFVDGMNRIYKQLLTELEAIGVAPIEAVGHEFDPNLHNAVMQVESEEYESGIVAQELQKGYTYRDTVVRHSMVAVVE